MSLLRACSLDASRLAPRSLLVKRPKELDAAEAREVDEQLEMLERSMSTMRQRFSFPRGYDETILCMRLNLDPPAAHHRPRPLFYYGVTDGLLCGLVTPALMRQRGFTLHKKADLTYWHRPAPTAAHMPTGGKTKAATPLVFVHGVGLGPLPYIGFLDDLGRQSDGGMIVIELPFVANRLSALRQVRQQLQWLQHSPQFQQRM